MSDRGNGWMDWLMIIWDEWHPSLPHHLSSPSTASWKSSFVLWMLMNDGNCVLGVDKGSLQLFTNTSILYLCIRSTPWTCSSVKCGLMSDLNSRAPLKSYGWTTAWWTRSGHRTRFSETQRSLFLITWPHLTNSSASCRMELSSTPWGDLEVIVLLMRSFVDMTPSCFCMLSRY